jgi:hypothetical protein
MHRLVSQTYFDIEEFILDLIRFDELIEKWEENHPGYEADTIAEIDGGEFYTITIICRRP